jgi:hypothetical protein
MALVCALVVACPLVGCGGDDSSTTTADASNLPAPKPKEGLDQAQTRVAKALTSGDCQQINELNPVNRPSLDTDERCEYLKRLAGLKVDGAQAYGGAGAVIDYRFGDRIYSTVLIRDEDGLYHVAFFNPFGITESAGTKYAKAFDGTARQTLQALKERDCKAFQEVAFVRFGIGKQDEDTICDFVENNAISNQLEDFPDAEFKPAGGNADYAFYTLATPATRWVLVFAREADRAGQPAELDLPDGAPTYGFVGAYLIVTHQPSDNG